MDEASQLSGLEYLKTIYGAKINRSDAVLNAWKWRAEFSWEVARAVSKA